MSTKITPETLIEMGFKKHRSANKYFLFLKGGHIEVYIDNFVDIILNGVGVCRYRTNATTIEDIKDLIRLFK